MKRILHMFVKLSPTMSYISYSSYFKANMMKLMLRPNTMDKV